MTLSAAVDIETFEVVLLGDELGLRKLADALRRAQAMTLQLDEPVKRQLLRGLSVLRVVEGTGAVVVDVDESRVVMCGGRQHLVSLADAIDLHLEHNDVSEPGFHFHMLPPSAAPMPADEASPLSSFSRHLIVAGLEPDE